MLTLLASAATFAAVALSAGSSGAEGAPTASEARDKADEILSRPEFAPPDQSLFERGVGWLSDRLSDLLAKLFGGGSGSFMSWLVLGVCVAIVVGLGYLLVRTLRRDPKVSAADDEGEVVRSAADWGAEAQRLEAAGSWKAALRARYRELIAELVARSVVRDVPGRTTGEYRTEVRRRAADVADDFDEASALFDDAWYGDLPTGPAENEAFRAHAARVIAGVKGSRDRDLVGAAS